MAPKMIAAMGAACLAVVDGLLAWLKNAEWMAKYLPDFIKPALTARVAFAFALFALLLYWNDRSQKRDTANKYGSALGINNAQK